MPLPDQAEESEGRGSIPSPPPTAAAAPPPAGSPPLLAGASALASAGGSPTGDLGHSKSSTTRQGAPEVESRVRSVRPLQVCPTSETAPGRMGLHIGNPAYPGDQRVPGAGGASAQRQEARPVPEPGTLLGRLFQTLPTGRVALSRAPGTGWRPGVFLAGSAAGRRPPFTLTEKPMST